MKLKLLFLFMAVCLVTPAFAADDMDTFNRRLSVAKDKVETAEIYKAIGDDQAAKGLFDKAAEAYLKALPHVRDRLTEDETTQIAIYLSWGGKLREAETELRALLQKNPANARARTQLARVLLWSESQEGVNSALAEAETVLKKLPDDRDALRVKAEGLRFKGEADRAITIYKGLLERSDDFDTRIGLSYAYLEKGDIGQARTSSSPLRPVFPYQKQDLEKLNREIEKASQPPPKIAAVSQADSLKAEGDALAAKQQFIMAAGKYEEALALSPRFPVDEWLAMATVMSWGGKHKAARRELEALLIQDPANVPARLQLARVLLWTGEFDAAIGKVETILTTQPGNRDALTVKANALRLKGFNRDADRLYKALLTQAEDFDVREGLTYRYLTGGERLKTDESLALMKPRYPYEEKGLAQIRIDRDAAFRPRLSGGVSFYGDKDDNRVTTYATGAQFWLGNWRTNLDYSHVSAWAPGRSNESDYVNLSTYSRMPWYGGIGGGVGLAQGSFMTWKALVDFDVLYGSVGFLASSDSYAYTAQLIENGIRALTLSASIVQRPTDRITLRGGYSYREYSDDNNSHDVQASLAFLFFRKPAIAVGYRFRYLDFRRQSGGGYWDPDNYFANSGFVNLSFEANRVYGYIEPYIGYHSYTRFDESQGGVFYGFAGSLGYRMTNWMALEGTAEWGNYAGSSAVFSGGEGWYYNQVGLRLIISF